MEDDDEIDEEDMVNKSKNIIVLSFIFSEKLFVGIAKIYFCLSQKYSKADAQYVKK